MLHDDIDVEREQDSLAQGLLMKEGRNDDLLRTQELIDKADELKNEVVPVPLESLAPQFFVGLARRLEGKPLQPELLRQLFQVDDMDLVPIRGATKRRRNLGADRRLRRIE